MLVAEMVFTAIVLVGFLYSVCWFINDFDKECKKIEENKEEDE